MIIIEKTIEEKRKDRKGEIKIAWQQALTKGFVCSNGIKMDADWDAILKFKTGIEHLKAGGAGSILVRDHDNEVHTVVISEAETMLSEMIDNYYVQIKKKWSLQDQADKSEELENIKWS